MHIHSLSVPLCPFQGCWKQSQFDMDENRVHPGQFASPSQGIMHDHIQLQHFDISPASRARCTQDNWTSFSWRCCSPAHSEKILNPLLLLKIGNKSFKHCLVQIQKISGHSTISCVEFRLFLMSIIC